MGSSCTSGKSYAKKSRAHSNTATNTTHSSPKQNPADIPSVFYEQIMKENYGGQDVDIDLKMTTHKNFSKYLSNTNTAATSTVATAAATACHVADSKSNKSSTSTNCTIPAKYAYNAACTKSESNVQKKRKVNHLENFILERKKYMAQRGVVVYTPYTVLPPPILKSVEASSLQRKRINTIQKDVSLKTIYQNRKRSTPTNMLSGDVDSVVVEI